MNSKKKNSSEFTLSLTAKERKEIVEELSQFLADSYTLYLKIHKFIWSVTSPQSKSLNLMRSLFRELLDEQWLAVELITKRIHSLGAKAPETSKEIASITAIKPSKGYPRATEMIRELMEEQETLIRSARSTFSVAEKANDQPTCNLLLQRIQIHEKYARRLGNLLEEWDRNNLKS